MSRHLNLQGHYGRILAMLLGLFCFRVFAQLWQRFVPTASLPPFDHWHSGALPYSLLLFFQFIIIALGFRVVMGFLKGTCNPSQQKGRWLFGFASLYFTVMAARLVIGFTWPHSPMWFQATLPAFFHLVLASFVGVWGYFHLKG